MGNDVSGEVRDNGTVVQIHHVRGDMILGWRPPRRKRAGWPRVLLAMLLISGQQCGINALGDAVVPAGEAIPPPGVDRDVVTRLVAVKLRDCTGEVVAAPPNCPQRGSVPPNAVSVRWHLVSGATDGMRMVWHEDGFRVTGAAAMRLSYHDGTPRAALARFRFRTEVRWRGAQTSRGDVGPISEGGSEAITKPRSGLGLRAITDAIREEFAACAIAPHDVPMPDTCPHTMIDPLPEQRNARWVLTSDPLINPVIEEDAEFGLVRVTAAYSASLHEDRDKGRRTTATASGTYVATLVGAGAGTADVLEIRHVP